MRHVCKKSPRERLVCMADSVGMTLLACPPTSRTSTVLFSIWLHIWVPSVFATTSRLFFQNLFSHVLCSCLEAFIQLTTSAISDRTISKKTSNQFFCSCDDIFTEKWNCGAPYNLRKCTESPSTLWTNASIDEYLYLSWNNLFLKTFRLKMIVWRFTKHQNKMSDTDRNKGYFFTARVSPVKVNTMEGLFQQLSEL